MMSSSTTSDRQFKGEIHTYTRDTNGALLRDSSLPCGWVLLLNVVLATASLLLCNAKRSTGGANLAVKIRQQQRIHHDQHFLQRY